MSWFLDAGMMADLKSMAWSETETAATNTVTATKTGVTGKVHLILGIIMSGDNAGANWALNDGATVLAQGKLPANNTVCFTTPVPMPITAGATATLVITGATSYCAATIWGLTY